MSSGSLSTDKDKNKKSELVAEQGKTSTSLPKVILAMADLPSGTKVMTNEFLGLNKKMKENVIILQVGSSMEVPGKTKRVTPVWVIAKDDFLKKGVELYEIRQKLTQHHFIIENQASAEGSLISTLYENSETSSKKVDLEGTELYDTYLELVGFALRERVSDIHIEKRSTASVVRMRRNGQLIFYKDMGNQHAEKLCRIIYNVLAENQDITFREDIYQACAINTVVEGVEVKLRYQSLPVYPGGFDVILRVLPIGSDDETFVPLENLGYSSSQVKMLFDAASQPVGALIIAGTTGSGKSTTLKNLLMWINHSRDFKCKIFTIEDPPEYKIPKVSQIPVVRRENDDPNISPFLAPLTATMRGDPDILMIGEIRDKFTGDGLKKATQSGHQVLTTVHATSALGICERISDFNITPSVMGSPEFLNALIYQKLVPLLCQNCSIPFSEHISSGNVSERDLQMVARLERVCDLEANDIRVAGEGCSKCKNTGISGRTVCAEIIAPDFAMLKFFREQASIEAKLHWRKLSDGDPDSDNMTGKTVLEHAIQKMRRGLVSPHDVEELFGAVDGSRTSLEQMEQEAKQKGIIKVN